MTINPRYTGAADTAVNLVGCKSPHHQLPGNGWLVCPVRAEATKHVLPGRKSLGCSATISRSGGNDLGGEQTWGLNITECLQPRKSFPRKVASWTKAESRPNLPRGRPMTSGKLTGACTRWDRRGRGPGNQGKTRR